MKLPLRRIPNTTPPLFSYFQIVTPFGSPPQAVECSSSVPASMETALCDLLLIAEQLAKENEELKCQLP